MENVFELQAGNDVVQQLMELAHKVRLGEIIGVTVVQTSSDGSVSMRNLMTPLKSPSVVAA